MTVHNYRPRQVHETLNGVNPSSGFRDMRSAKSGPNLWQIWQVFGPWASPYGANGQMSITVHNYRPRQFHRTSNGENPSSGYRDMGSASLAAARPTARPPARPPGPWRQYPSSPEGWGVKNRTLLDNQVNTVAADAQASCQVFNIQDKGTLAFISLWGRISTTCTYVLSVERWWIYKQTYFHFSLKNSEAEPNTYLPHRTQWATSLEIRPVPATGWLPLVFDFQGNDYLWLRHGPLLVVPHT